MNILLILAFLFFIGSVAGWVLELFYRHFSPANRDHKWINPGFCTGPYVPLYGCGLCLLYLIASMESLDSISGLRYKKVILFVLMAVMMTVIEYIAGIFLLKAANVRLWDYSGEWGNVNGLICPKFSFYWAVISAFYYFVLHPRILSALNWLSNNLAFSFVIGLFFGVFIIDVANSFEIVEKLRAFAKKNNVIVRYESVKQHIRAKSDERKHKYSFFSPFQSDRPLSEHLKEMFENSEHKAKHDS